MSMVKRLYCFLYAEKQAPLPDLPEQAEGLQLIANGPDDARQVKGNPFGGKCFGEVFEGQDARRIHLPDAGGV